MSTATTTTKQSDLERVYRIQNLILNFGWEIERPMPALDDEEKKALDEFLDLIDSQAVSLSPIPGVFWRCVCPHWTPKFKCQNDARLMAMALMPHADSFYEWTAERSVPSSDYGIQFLLEQLNAEYSSSAGVMFAELQPDTGINIWFGRKAGGQLPFFTGQDTIDAARFLFGVKAVARPVSGREEPATKAEPTTAKAKSPKMVAKKELPAVAKGKPSRSETDRATEKPLIAAPKQSLEFIDIDCIESDPENDRKTFDKSELQELVDSIKKHGVLQPILLRAARSETGHNSSTSHNRYVIVAGERRWRAAKIAGLKELPAQISDREGLQVSLARLDENLKRVDLSPIEKAQGLKRLMDAHGLTQKEVGEAVGVQQGQVSNMLRLLNLPESLQQLVAEGKIAPTFIRVLLPYCDLPAVMDEVAKIFVRKVKTPDAPDGRIELRDVESWIRNAVVNHSRPMKFQQHWSEYSNPSPKDRHFSKVSDENLKLLAPRKIDVMNDWEGKERTFNVKLFDELNKTPLANRREKHKKYKADRGQSTGTEKTTAKTERPFDYEWKVEQLLEARMAELLADAIEATKPSSNRQKLHAVVLTLAISSGEMIIEEIAGHKTDWRNRVGVAVTKLDCSPAECDRFLQQLVVKDLRNDSHLDCKTAIALAKMLGVDLVKAWSPGDEFMKALTDHGRELVAAAGHDLPDFLLPFFGIEKKPAKAKKGKAA
jgi:ParB family chromosome partitioning protein